MMTINTQTENIINFFMDFIEEHCSKDAIRKIKSEEMQDQLMKLAKQEMTDEDTKELRMNQRIDALEENYQGIDKLIKELSLNTKIEKMFVKERQDIGLIYEKMKQLHGDVTNQLLLRPYGDLIECEFKGVRYWQSTKLHNGWGDTRLFDYETCEYVGILNNGLKSCSAPFGNVKVGGLLVNPVYAVKWQDKYPHLFELCLRQKREDKDLSYAAPHPWAIFGRLNASIFSSTAEIGIKLTDRCDKICIETGVMGCFPQKAWANMSAADDLARGRELRLKYQEETCE